LFCPWLAPSEGEYTIFLADVISKPTLQSMSATYLFPYQCWRLDGQWVFDVNFLFSHIVLGLVIDYYQRFMRQNYKNLSKYKTFCRKILVVPKKCVPLHPQNSDMAG
jgi:hypothetical protein